MVSRHSQSTKSNEYGPMAKREARFAHFLLLPTLIMVFSIVLFPLATAFWISLKPITLADLRPPTPVVKERVRGKAKAPGDTFRIEYRLRNSSRQKPISDVILMDVLPDRLTIQNLDPRCTIEHRTLTCRLGDWKPGENFRLRFEVKADEGYLKNPVKPNLSEPTIVGKSDNILLNFDFTLDNFVKVFTADEFWFILIVTFAYTLFGTGGALLVGLLATQLMRETFRGRAFFRGILLFPYVAPVIAMAFTWLVLLDPFSGALNALMKQMNLMDEPLNFIGVRATEFELFGLSMSFPVALTTVIVFEIWRYFPMAFLFILARAQSIPTDMYEAAEMDGASPLQMFWELSLPFLYGIISVLFLLRFIWTFNKFDDIFLLTGGASGTRTLTVDVYEQGFALSDLGAGSAVAVLIFFILLGFSVFYFRTLAKEEGL